MRILARITNYFAPPPAPVSVADANRQASLSLLKAERNHWETRYINAKTPEELKEACEQIDMLREMEAQIRE
jgi:hypothetical protein